MSVIKNQWVIRWKNEVANTYMYGSILEFDNNKLVHFENPLMPPGTVIKTWYSMTKYAKQGIEPTLPIIDGESSYHIIIDIDVPEDEQYLVRLVFLDKYENEAGYVNVFDKEADFRCPLKTYSYKMQLVNGGMTKFIFRSIIIQEVIHEQTTSENKKTGKKNKTAKRRNGGADR